jgi:lysophospholipase L1-like esterase
MKRFLQAARAVAVIVAVTLAIDFLVTLFIPARVLDSWLRARDRDDAIYDRTVPWHHEIRPNLDTTRLWGFASYPFKSDAFGSRTGRCAADDPASEKDRTIFVIGDSFAEGLGLPFEQSFAGLMACAYRQHGLVARNLGTMSYSPTIYWRRVDDAVRRLGFPPREIVLFLDMSDIHNEAQDYLEIDGRIYSERPTPARRAKDFLKRNFTSAAVAFELNQRYLVVHAEPIAVRGNPLSRWTVDEALMKEFGERGLARAAANLERLAAKCRGWGCRMTLVVYPWPDQIAEGDRDSIQVRYWREWSAKNDVRFVNAFEPFFGTAANETIGRYYIKGDVHFNEAGNRLIFDTVWKTIAPR